MVEVPSAVWLAPRLIREVDFFSIGTNDLIQYLLAADRNNPRVAHLYEALHPAVLSAIAEVVNVARAAGKEVCICGEMASDPLATLLLIGMGLDQLSLSPLVYPGDSQNRARDQLSHRAAYRARHARDGQRAGDQGLSYRALSRPGADQACGNVPLDVKMFLK